MDGTWSHGEITEYNLIVHHSKYRSRDESICNLKIKKSATRNVQLDNYANAKQDRYRDETLRYHSRSMSRSPAGRSGTGWPKTAASRQDIEPKGNGVCVSTTPAHGSRILFTTPRTISDHFAASSSLLVPETTSFSNDPHFADLWTSN